MASIADYWVAQQIAIKPGVSRGGSSSGRTSTASTGEAVSEEIPLYEQGDSDIQAYPNPVNNYVVIRVEGMTEKPNDGDVSILDRVGRMYPANSQWDGQNKELAIDFDEMGAGIYFIKVNTSTGSKFVRIIKVSE